MNTERKLELTLCGMLPYGLKIKSSMGVIPLVKVNNTVSLMNGLCVDDVEKNKNYKPLLHSLDKLTKPILEGGLIASEELKKMGYNLCFDDDYTLEDFINHGVENCAFGFVEYLKSNHFNIYDLPSDMYIEKSTVKL